MMRLNRSGGRGVNATLARYMREGLDLSPQKPTVVRPEFFSPGNDRYRPRVVGYRGPDFFLRSARRRPGGTALWFSEHITTATAKRTSTTEKVVPRDHFLARTQDGSDWHRMVFHRTQ